MKNKILFFLVLCVPIFVEAESKVINLGQPGASARRVQSFQVPKAIEMQPKLVFVLTGTMDFVNPKILTPVEEYEKTMRKIVEDLQNQKITVILATLPKCNQAILFARHKAEEFHGITPNQRIEAANQRLREIAKDYHCPLLDFAAEVQKSDITGKDSLIRNPLNNGGNDGIRLTVKGLRQLAISAFELIRNQKLPDEKIVCIGDDMVYGIGSPAAGKSEGESFPGYLNLFLNKKQPRIGFFTEEFRYGDTWRKFGLYDTLKEENMIGNAVKTMNWIYGDVSEEDIFEEFCKYHAVIISLDRGFRSYDYEETTANYCNALQRYLEQGGGVLLIPQNGEYKQDRRPEIFNLMFKKYGITMLREGINDPANEFSYQGHPFLSTSQPNAPSYLSFFITRNIMKSPATRNIKTLYFPQWGCGAMWGTMAIELSQAWEVVVRGEKTARSYLCESSGAKNTLFQTEGSIKSAPPLAAIRNYGEKARMGVLSCNLMHLTLNHKALDWPAVFEKNGDGKTPSDGQQLLINYLQYLSEPALNNPRLGTFQLPADFQPKSSAASINFDQVKFPAPSKLSKGVIGLHSAFSDGKGSIREYADAAMKQGLQFIVFTESLEELTPEKYEQLKRECQAVSSAGFYACPGIEFTAGGGLRWVFWGEAVRYPDSQVMDAEGKIVYWRGLYAAQCDRRPSALLNYNRLRKLGDPANLWWYFRIPIKVYRNGVCESDNLPEYLFALDDIRGIGSFVYNGIYSPEKLFSETSHSGLNLVYGGMKQVKQWLNSKNILNCNDGYFSEGPEIRLWSGINAVNSSDYGSRTGWQRVRLKFSVSSSNGIAEVKVLDGARGIFRRFDGHGKTEFVQEFEAVHDRVHSLVLEAKDQKGKIAVSQELRILNPLYAITRCSDNLNLLGYSTLSSHPDRHQLVSQRGFEDLASSRPESEKLLTPITGIDSAEPFVFSPRVGLNFNFFTDVGNQLGGNNKLDDWNAVVQRYPLNSNAISIITADSNRRVNTQSRHKPNKRISYRSATFFALGAPQPIADIEHTSYLLRSRIVSSQRFTRPWLAANDYRGGVMFHELKFTFKKDVILKGSLPIQIATMKPGSMYFNASRGYWNRLVAKGSEKVLDLPPKKMHQELENGGFFTILSENSSRRMVLIPFSDRLTPAFEVTGNGSVHFGLGKENEAIRQGETVSLKLLVVTQIGQPNDINSLEALSAFFKLDGGQSSLNWQATTGAVIGNPPFAAFRADNGEVCFIGDPIPGICDYPVMVKGIEDNGCAAYYESTGAMTFVFAPVLDNVMYFQIPTDSGVKVWAGNIFIASDKNLKLTLVIDGQTAGKQPFLEIHNPTASAISAIVSSPAGTPRFGGTSFTVTVPAGASYFCSTSGKQM